jgi:PAS domain S-box-containing protein
VEFSCDGIKNDVEQRYEVLLQMAPFGFLLIDLAGNIIEVNKPALDILGSPSEEATKAINMLSFQPLEDAGVSQLVRDAITSRSPITQTFRYTSKWDKTVSMKCTACSIRDASDSVCFVAFLIEDISLLEQMRDKYYRIAKTLASVVDHIPHYIWAKDSSGTYHMVSKSYADLFFKTPREMVGMTDHDLFPVAMTRGFQSDDEEVLSSCGLKDIYEVVTTPRDGSRRWRTIKTAVCDEDGTGLLTVGIAEDITQEYTRRETAKSAIKELSAFINRNKPHV